MHKILRLLTLLVAIILLVTIYIQLPFARIPSILARPSILELAGWLTLNLLIVLMLVYRWQLLVRPLNSQISFFSLLMMRQAGQVVSFITPGPQFGGEPLQVYWLWKNFGLPAYQALLAVGLDRFFELWINFAVLVLALILLGYYTTTSAETWLPVLLSLLLLISLLSGLAWILIRSPDRMAVWIERLASRWQQAAAAGTATLERIHVELIGLLKGHRPALLRAFFASLLAWVGMGFELWLLLSFFDPQADVNGLILLFVAVRLAFLLPLPGGIGTLEAAVLWVCQARGLPADAAVGIIVLMRIRDALIMGGGLLALRSLNHRVAITP